MSILAQFAFQSNQVRILVLDNEPWFVAKDVAQVLEYVDNRRMLDLVDEEDKQVINPQKIEAAKIAESFSSNTFKVSIINESGLYAVIFGSTKPSAKAFKKWVTSEVLPQIRKTGKYEPKPLTPGELLKIQAEAIIALEQRQQRLELEQQLQSQKLAELELLTHQHDAEIDRIFNPNGHYLAVVGYYRKHNLGAIPVQQAAVIGKKATAYCKNHGITVSPVADPRFGLVNTYPEDVIALFV
jgi:prophage antirepressor-like protein